MHKIFFRTRLVVLFLALASCTTLNNSQSLNQSLTKNVDRKTASDDGVATASSQFPQIAKDDSGELLAAIKNKLGGGAKVQSRKKNNLLLQEDMDSVALQIRNYFLFLGLSAHDFEKPAKADQSQKGGDGDTVLDPPVAHRDHSEDAEGDGDSGDSTPSNLQAVERFFIASNQFLFCQNLTDTLCLEKEALAKSSAKFRWAQQGDLGQPIHAGSSLDMDVFFTEAWDGKTAKSDVVDRLAERLNKDARKSLSIAMYGIDSVQTTMKPVYDAISAAAQNPNMDVRVVVDVAGIEKPEATQPWIFSYQEPQDASLLKRWIFSGPLDNPDGMHTKFEYEATPLLIRDLNKNIRSENEARARVEWPSANIMHNKFAVLENVSGEKSVWSGTANFSDHCMGSEANANMSIYIRNDVIAQAFLDEFNLMYNFSPDLTVKSKVISAADGSAVPAGAFGRFHHNKYSVSHRLFQFDDGTTVRVHFAPTDDAEHRVILPMLLSAQAGDTIRISMFGGTGYEIIRALQYAQAKGANVKIVYDSKLGYGATSWVRDSKLNLTMPNPYLNAVTRPGGQPVGQIEVRMSNWAGKNHYKVGTLTRRQSDGSEIVEELIVGSQNWSTGGNDNNDENLVSIQNFKQSVEAGHLFNQEFDGHLWTASRVYYDSANPTQKSSPRK